GDGEEPLDSPVGYPCVLKPSDGTGSVGVHLCNDRAALQDAMSSVRARCRTIRDYDLSRRWLIEEYVEGPEYSAEMICQDRQWHLIGVTKKSLSPPPHFIEIGHVFPAPFEPARVEVIRDTCRTWLEAIGLDFGAAHIEFRMTDDGPVLMEINPRLAGGMIPELVRLATGFEPLKSLF